MSFNRRQPLAPVASPKIIAIAVFFLILTGVATRAQKYRGPDGKLRIALVKQPYSPTGTSVGPNTMANGGIQKVLAGMNTDVRVQEVALTPRELTEYGAWKKLGWRWATFQRLSPGMNETATLRLAYWQPALRCLDWLPDFSTQAVTVSHSRSACSGLMLILISIRPKQRAVVRSVGCRWPWLRVARCSECVWTRISIHR